MFQDRLKVNKTRERNISDFQCASFTCVSDERTPLSFDAQEKYDLSATIGITFWANPAEYERARAIAERALMDQLFGDMNRPLHELLHAISDGDRKRAFDAADQLCKLAGWG